MALVRFIVVPCVAAMAFPLHAENWPQWRGPDGNGVSSETDLPIAWNEHAGIEWKCKLPEWGNSTPAVWDDAVFLTSQDERGRLLLLRIDTKTGRIAWTREVGQAAVSRSPLPGPRKQQRGQQDFHATHNMASPSPVTDGRLVIAHFGNGDLAAYDFDGERLWHRNLQQDYGKYTIWWGHANSPVLYGDLVISVCMQDSCEGLQEKPAPSYLVAHHKRSGDERWKTMRPTEATAESCDSYTTPVFRQTGDGPEMVVMGGQVLDAYDPLSGRRRWYLPGLFGNRVIPGPLAAHGMIYATQGMRRPLLAIKPQGPGKRTRKEIVWQYEQGTSDSPTPVVAGQFLFMIDNNGVARCIDAHSGHLKWKQRLQGSYRASPFVAESRVYFLNTQGLTTVISASPRFDRLTENRLHDTTFASPAAAGGRLFVRGHKWLYCLRK